VPYPLRHVGVAAGTAGSAIGMVDLCPPHLLSPRRSHWHGTPL